MCCTEWFAPCKGFLRKRIHCNQHMAWSVRSIEIGIQRVTMLRCVMPAYVVVNSVTGCCSYSACYCCMHAQVNKEPFSGGWLMKVKLSDKGELDSLLDASKYEEHCAKSEH